MPASTGTFYGIAMTAGNVYTVAGNGTLGYSGDGGPATTAELFLYGYSNTYTGVAIDSAGNLLFGDSGNSRIRVVAARTGTYYGQAMTAGDIYTIAGDGTDGYSGDGGPATSAALTDPGSVTVDGSGNVLVTEYDSRVRVVAEKTGTYYGVAMTAGDIYTVAGNGTDGYRGDGGPARSAELGSAPATALDASGNIVIADLYNERIRVVAAKTGTYYGIAMTTGDIYTIAGGGSSGLGDGGAATSGELSYPEGVAVDASGNVLVADNGHYRLRVVAASTGTFYGQAMTAGDIYTVAGDGNYGSSGDGGPATAAELENPRGVAVDHTGNQLVASATRVRVIAAATGTFYGQAMTAGDIYTVAGNGGFGYSGDGGLATLAELDNPSGVVVDASANDPHRG